MNCTEDDCRDDALARELCPKHYMRAKRAGTLGARSYLDPSLPLKDRLLASCEERPSGCWEWTKTANTKGYGRIGWQGKMILASRASFETFIRPLAEGEIVRHTCDNPPCIRPSHLVAGTHADNRNDAVQRERAAVGERVGSAKLTEDLVRQLRGDREAGASYKQLRATYGLSLGTISFIVNRKTWKHV